MDTQITFVLDSSGSMQSIRDDTIGGYNTFLADQREEPGEATVSLYDFNTDVEQLYQGKRVKAAPELTEETYTPGGRTALHDAIATAITDTSRYIEQLAQATRPETVILVVLTDGKENASETSHDQVTELVETYQNERDWELLFIGANQDAALTAGKMGIDQDRSLEMSDSGEGAQAAYQSTSRNISQARRGEEIDGYTNEDRQRQRDANNR
jgi:hypothetical protein